MKVGENKSANASTFVLKGQLSIKCSHAIEPCQQPVHKPGRNRSRKHKESIKPCGISVSWFTLGGAYDRSSNLVRRCGLHPTLTLGRIITCEVIADKIRFGDAGIKADDAHIVRSAIPRALIRTGHSGRTWSRNKCRCSAWNGAPRWRRC